MPKLFISHSSQDDAFVRELRWTLADLKQDAWIDSRELRGGDLLLPEIQKAIEDASGYAIVVSTWAFESDWVAEELEYALKVQEQRGRANYPVIPLSLNGAKLGVFKRLFNYEPLFIPVSSMAGGVEAAMNPILVAMGRRLHAEVPDTPQPKTEPLEELVLELTDLKFQEPDGVRRASARARLVYEPATPGQREVASEQQWRFIAPIGPIEAGELRWYLEKYAVWPSHYFSDRARKVEENLVKWGQLLYEGALPGAHTANVMRAWAGIHGHAGRRFSVHVDATLEAGASDTDLATAREAATLLLGLPWELLHDRDAYLFQGAKPTRVRRRLPNWQDLDVATVAAPIRVLLVTARPEDEACGYIDHRASALPLVDAMEELGGLVRIHVLSPPTLPALGTQLKRAYDAHEPYHVVHFDGHGVYDRRVGLGGLCFENPDHIDRLEDRGHLTVFTSELGPLLKAHRIPLVFLEACQTATAEDASDSVASDLLQRGVASVVAMSHSVLVETARRFVQTFYGALACGARVGDAMLEGQIALNADKSRGRIFGVGELKLHDWFVPVLFQEKDDPQLFRNTPAPQTHEDLRTILGSRLGELPAVPETGFIGRSRELLALQRLLADERYAVIRGQGGEGKTALAAEFARWMVRSHQMRRVAFVSVETNSNVLAVLDAIGRQLAGKDYSVATFDDLEKAILPVERALAEQATLLVVDNMESILELPYQVGWTERSEVPAVDSQSRPESPELRSAGSGLQSALTEDARHELDAILKLCSRLNAKGDTRLIFTSREVLPAPFDAARHRRELHQLDRGDAVKLVERALNSNQPPGASPRFPNQPAAGAVRPEDVQREEIEQLVDAVHGHARTLALLAPALRSIGVEATRTSLVELMADMGKRFPGSREQSVFASVELSLRRMSEANRERAHVLGVFHGGVQLGVLHMMMQSRKMDIPVRPEDEKGNDDGQECPSYDQLSWEEADVASLAVELIQTGLATPNCFNHLTLNPALCPYLREIVGLTQSSAVPAEESAMPPALPELRSAGSGLQERWVEAMCEYAGFLVQQRTQNAEVAARLAVLELPNLFALLDLVQRAGDAEASINLTTSLYSLLSMLGKPRLLECVGQVRAAASASLGDTVNHARFQAARTRIEQQLFGGQMREAFKGAQLLLQRARTVGEQAYPGADDDLAMAHFTLARVLKTAGGSEQALPLLDESRQRFEAIAKARANDAAERMANVCIGEKAECFDRLSRFDEAVTAYEENIRRAEQLGDVRQMAVGKGNLGATHTSQRRYPEALAAHAEARERFTQLDEPGAVAVSWHETGRVYQQAGQPEAAEDAYRNSLAINVRLGDVAGQALTLGQLGNLYQTIVARAEEAVAFYRQAADKYIEISDVSGEGRQRNNLAALLRKLCRPAEARQEIRRAIECGAQFGHASSPWMSWSILAVIETDAGNPAAAAKAKGTAIASYLADRSAGGENHDAPGRISLAVTQSLLAADPAQAASLLQQQAPRFEAAGFGGFIRALQAIVAGSRDRTLADASDLDYSMATEILFLIETLEQRP